MVQICIVVLVGLPGAGKTSFCTYLEDILRDNKNYECHTITYDNIVGDRYKDNYKECRNQCLIIAKNVINNIIHNNSILKNLVVIDDNMYYRSMRFEYFKIAKQYGISFMQMYFNIPVDCSLNRNSVRDQQFQIPKSVIKDMATKLEIPSKNNYWESNCLTVYNDTVLSDEFISNFLVIVNHSFSNPVSSVVEQQLPRSCVSMLHKVDLVLRKIVGDAVSRDPSQASIYNSKRKEIFAKVKSCNIEITDNLSEDELMIILKSYF